MNPKHEDIPMLERDLARFLSMSEASRSPELFRRMLERIERAKKAQA